MRHRPPVTAQLGRGQRPASSGLEWTFARPSFFTQNLSTTHVADIRDHDQIYRHARQALDMPAALAVVTAAMYTSARFGLAAGLTDDVHHVTGRIPLDVEATARREQAAWSRVAGVRG